MEETMFSNKKWSILLGLVVVASMLLSACGPTAEPQVVTAPPVVVTELVPGATSVIEVQVTVPPEVVEVTVPPVVVTATPEPSKRTGAWVDMLVFTEQNSAQAAVKQLQADDIDVYAYSVGDPEIFQSVKEDSNLSYTNAFGSYTELTFNPSGPEFQDGRLNPFSNAKIREAMNWLVDRDYMVQEIYGGLGSVKYTSLNSAFPDYAKYVDTLREIETYYAYNPDKAKEVITAEMEAMGATLGADGKWTYKDAPVVIIAIIRTEDERTQIGDYVCNQLETVGFTTDRQYKTRTEASPIWNQSDPTLGLMHFYTGGWITTAVSRDDATNFGYFYTNLGSSSPLWSAYVNTPEFKEVCDRLWINDFATLDERKELFVKALKLAQEDSTRVWLVDQKSFSPQKAGLQVAYDLAGGVAGSVLYPYTLRWADQEGGTVRIAQPGVLVEPWNPIAGTNWIYDSMPQRATNQLGVMPDPYTGLYLPQRIEKADVVVKEGLPVAKTLDWLTLTFEPKIEVPADAWVDWDAVNQKFVTTAEKYTQTLEANTKVTVTYPKDLFQTVKWHDGSPLSMGDFIMRMIMVFDLGKTDSAIYDEGLAPQVDAFLSHFKAVVIESTDPLVITTYDDQIYLDAEWMITSWWPSYPYPGSAEAPWHTVALGVVADAKGELAFSTDKAGAKGIEWMSFIAGPSLAILKADLDTLVMTPTLPYEATLGQYVTPEEAAARWTNLKEWYGLQGHFWVGSGPFWLDKAFPIEKTLTLRRFEQFPDPASKWAGFGTPMIPVVVIDGPGEVAIGTEAVYDVFVTFEDQPYPAAKIADVKYLVFDANSLLIASGPATAAEEGHYTVTLGADVTGKLAAGSNKLEVVVTSNAVSIPGMAAYEFVTK